jgi:alpha-amylase
MKIKFLLFLAWISFAANAQRVSQWPRVVSYEIFVHAFADSNGDGIGDIKGMTSKLDYLKDLGIENVWLMPVNPSPSYHKYDVTNYYGIHPDYGTIDDFKTFVSEAHKRNIKVVIDMVLNHCSSEHPWFKAAANNPSSPYWEYFVWTHKDDPQLKTTVTRTEADSHNQNRWNKINGSDYLYYSYFGGHMPDLNFDSPKLREEVFKIGRFWLTEMGIDGFRLDAARHIFHDERATDSHNWWVYFSSEMRKVKKDAYMVGEVWSSSDVVAPYLKGIPALFNFDLGYAITKAVNESDADSLAIRHQKINSFYQTVNPDFVDATFLTNHDQNRVMSVFNNDVNKPKVAAAILLTLPGSPYIYYGEEIGMHGQKPDEYIREPFLWDTKEKDKIRTRWIEPRHSSDNTVVPVSGQIKDRNSLLNHYKTLIALRNSSKALTYGELEPVSLGRDEVCAFQRKFQEEELLILHNVSNTDLKIDLPENLKSFNKIKYTSANGRLEGNKLSLPAYGTALLMKY